MHFIWKILVFTSYYVTTAKVKAVLVTLQLYLPVMAGWALELGPKEVVTVTTWWLFHRPANQPVLSHLSLIHTHTHTLPKLCVQNQRAQTRQNYAAWLLKHVSKYRATKRCSYLEIWRAESGVAVESVLPFGMCLHLLHKHEPADDSTTHARHVANCPPSDTANRTTQLSPATDAHMKFVSTKLDGRLPCSRQFLDSVVISLLYWTKLPTVCLVTGNICSRGHTLSLGT